MNNLASFAIERIGSLVSKKVGAAVGAEAIVGVANPELQGIPLIVFIIVQGIVDLGKAYIEKKA